MKTSSGHVPGSELIWNDIGDTELPDCNIQIIIQSLDGSTQLVQRIAIGA